VVEIDIYVTAGFNLKVEKPVAGEQVEHMIKERHRGANFGLTGAVDIQRELDSGLFRNTFNCCCS
jgi:hypothetical protein